MVLHKGARPFGFRIFLLTSFRSMSFLWYLSDSICCFCYYCDWFPFSSSDLIHIYLMDSAESGSEGSSDASDENTNQQVRIYA